MSRTFFGGPYSTMPPSAMKAMRFGDFARTLRPSRDDASSDGSVKDPIETILAAHTTLEPPDTTGAPDQRPRCSDAQGVRPGEHQSGSRHNRR